MISLRCVQQGKAFIVTIDNRIVNFYIEGSWFQLFPPNKQANIQKIMMSRNRIPSNMIDLINLTADEIKEGEDAKDDNDMYNIIVRDIKTKGAKIEEEKRGN